jgi:hypothetical protein
MAFLLSRIGLVRPRSEMIKIKSEVKRLNCSFYLTAEYFALKHQSVVRRDKERRHTRSAFHSSFQLLKHRSFQQWSWSL